MTEDIQEQSLDEPLLSQEMPPCPGRRLHEARVGKGLSVEEVATQLCLKVELINALEQDDYDKLPPPTFVGGYLRNYARLLGLPENDIIESYTRCVGEQSPSLIAATSLKTEAKASDLPIRIVTYLLVIGLGVMLFVWWMAQREEMRALLPEVVTSIEPGMNVVAEDDPISEQNLKQSHEQDIKTAATTVIIDNTKTDVLLEEIESVLPELPLEEVVEPSIPPLTADMPQTEVMLEFREESWVEIYDNAGRRLIYELVPENEMLMLQGEAPFNLFLGNAEGVMVVYEKASFDHSLYLRGEVARFSLGDTADNKTPDISEEE